MYRNREIETCLHDTFIIAPACAIMRDTSDIEVAALLRLERDFEFALHANLERVFDEED